MRHLTILAAAAEVCERHYGIRPIASLVPLPGRRHVFLVASGSGRYVLKCMAASDTEVASLRFTHKLVNLLSGTQFNTYSVIPTATGSTWVADVDMVWELHSFIEGHVLSSLGSSAADVGYLIGWYHKAAANLVSDGLLPAADGPGCGWLPVDPMVPLRVLRSRAQTTSGFALIERLMASAHSWLSSLGAPSLAIPLHGDVSPSNIIVANSSKYLIDFENIPWGDPRIDAAQAVSRLVSSGVVEADVCRNAARAFLSGYSESSALSTAAYPITHQLDLLVKLHLLLDWACRLLSRQATDSEVDEAGSWLLRGFALTEKCLS